MNITVRDVINILTTPKIEIDNTVDGLVSGKADSMVTGIGSAFLATWDVIETAKKMGINFIISHEGIFYSHRGNAELMLNDKVYEEKRSLIEKSGIAIYRYHDYIHRFEPDGVTAGLLRKLGWRRYEVENRPANSILEIPEMTVREVLGLIKEKLGVSLMRYVGDPDMPCRRVGVFVGYRGWGESVIPIFQKDRADLVIYGEGPEWETPEYVWDAALQGQKRALIVLGHGESEMPGMEALAIWLQKQIPEVPVCFIKNSPVFKFC